MVRESDVGILFGNDLHDRTLTEVKDPAEAAAAMKAKYANKTPSNFVIQVFRVDG